VNRFRPHLDLLEKEQRALLPKLSPLTSMGMILYRGTAIALRLGHRRSDDFDFFSSASLDKDAARNTCPAIANGETVQDEPDTLTILVSGVKVSLFGGLEFGRVGEPEVMPDPSIPVASALDLMATKLKVLMQRVSAKDYRDIAALISAGTDLASGLGAARQMYGPAFQPIEAMRALTWFQGGDLESLSPTEKRTLTRAVEPIQDIPVIDLASRSLSPGGEDQAGTPSP